MTHIPNVAQINAEARSAGSFIKNMAQLQKRLTAEQSKLAATDFEGDTAAGMVRVVIGGQGNLKRLTISPAVMDEGPEMVADLVQAAYNVAYGKKEAAAKAVLGHMTSGLLPLGLKLPGVG